VKIVVGLGNPGKRYEKTPHNAGFMVIDALAAELGCRVRRSLRFGSCVGKTVYGGEAVWLVKPQTYMNRSGEAVASVVRYLKIGPDGLIVVLDDADLPMGRMRLRPGGSSGGHKGLDSIIAGVGAGEFVRLRVGIGRSESGGALVEHVLSPFSVSEQRLMERMAGEAARAVRCVLDEGIEKAMNAFNGVTIETEQSGVQTPASGGEIE